MEGMSDGGAVWIVHDGRALNSTVVPRELPSGLTEASDAPARITQCLSKC